MHIATIVILSAVVLLSFTACDEGGTTPLPPPGNTPAQVLRSLMYAFNSRDVETLDGVLADDFTFHFDPDDVGNVIGDYTIPYTWGKEEFLEAVGSMFDQAYSIDFTVTTADVGDPDEGATEFTADDVQVSLLVMVDATNGFLAQGYCDFEFVNDDSAGYDDWLIIDWWDKTAASGTFSGTETSSLGEILALYM